MRVSDFDYDLPQSFIAQEPIEPRDSSRLLYLNRQIEQVEHLVFHDMTDLLHSGDVLVMNDTRVIPARLYAQKQETGGKVEILLLRQLDAQEWQVLIGGRNVNAGKQLSFEDYDLQAEVISELEGAQRILRFCKSLDSVLSELGEMPLPPYIHRRLADGERYQTIYSRYEGSAAAPTAGLHFTGDLLVALRKKGIKIAYCTLHIGLDTFQPVKVDEIADHRIHSERVILTSENAKIINEAKLAGGRVVAVGTTSARTLETAAILSGGGDLSHPDQMPDMCPWRPVIATERDTELFIYPGYQWRVVDALLTNFHLPKSTLLMMISAFAGRERVLDAYEEAKHQGYRFFSFGDAMFIT